MSKIEYLVAERKSYGSFYAPGYGFSDWEEGFLRTLGSDGWELLSDDGKNMRFKRVVEDEPEYVPASEPDYSFNDYSYDDDDDDSNTKFYLEQINNILSNFNTKIEQIKYTETVVLALLQDIAEKICPESPALADLKQLMSAANADTETETPASKTEETVAEEPRENPEENDMLAGFADEHIEAAFAGYEDEDKTLDLFARLAGLAGLLPHQSAENHFSYMIQAVYRFYNKEQNEKIKACYCRTLNAMACYFSSPATIETLNTMAVTPMTVSSATDIFFGIAIKQLAFEQSNNSPFVVDEMNEFIRMFVDQITENSDLSSDGELMKKIENYTKYIEEKFGFKF